MNSRSFLLYIFSLFGAVLLGCTDAGEGRVDQKPTHKVSGTITMAGGPVINATVTFSPKQGQPPALGKTDSSGKYTLTTYDAGDGAVEGEYVVLVSKSGASSASAPSADEVHKAMASGSAPPASHSGPAGKSSASEDLIPEKYRLANSSPLNETVEAGKENVFDFTLEP